MPAQRSGRGRPATVSLGLLLLALALLSLPACREQPAPAPPLDRTDQPAYTPLAPLLSMTAGPLLETGSAPAEPRLRHAAERRGRETLLTGKLKRDEWYDYEVGRGPREAVRPPGTPGLLRLTREDEGRAFLMTGHVACAEVDLVALEVESDGPGLLAFVWENLGQPRAELSKRYIFSLDIQPGVREYLVPVHGMPNWIGQARWFGVRAVELDRPVVLHAIRFLEAGPLTRRAMQQARGETPSERLVLGDESRPALHAPSGTVYEAGLEIPANAVLHAGFGYFPDTWRKQRPGLVFRVEALPQNGGPDVVLLDRFLDPKDWIGSRLWQDEELDLGELAGQQVTLRFSTLPPENDVTAELPQTHAAWSPPALVVADSRQRPDRRNVIVWLVDALRADRLSSYGADRRTSPHLDRLVRQGLLFTNPRSQASWTAAATGSLFTALYPSRHGAEREKQRLLTGCVTLAERLEAAGFCTMGLVANGHVKSLMNFDQGFHRYRFLRGRGDPPHADASQILELLRPMLEQAADKPFYLYVHSVDPHGPYTPPAPYDTLFTPPEYAGSIDGTYEPDDFRGRPLEQVSEQDLHQLTGLYDGEIAWSDLHLGMLVAELRRLGLLEKTLILVTGDHGEEFLDHGSWDHSKTLYTEQLRVPLAGRLPENARQAFPAGSLAHQPARLVDIYPSVLDFLGVTSSEEQLDDLDGTSFFSGTAEEEPLIFSEENKAEHLLFSVEQGRYKLIRRLKPEAKDELFDLQADPGEANDIAADHPELTERLAQAGEEIRSRRSLEREAVELDQETREELRALGYME